MRESERETETEREIETERHKDRERVKIQNGLFLLPGLSVVHGNIANLGLDVMNEIRKRNYKKFCVYKVLREAAKKFFV